jgi:hypothetical protein
MTNLHLKSLMRAVSFDDTMREFRTPAELAPSFFRKTTPPSILSLEKFFPTLKTSLGSMRAYDGVFVVSFFGFSCRHQQIYTAEVNYLNVAE